MTSAASQSLPNFSDRRFETSGTHFAFNMHAMLTTAKSPDTGTIPFSHVSTAIKRKRQTEHQDHLHAVSDTVAWAYAVSKTLAST